MTAAPCADAGAAPTRVVSSPATAMAAPDSVSLVRFLMLPHPSWVLREAWSGGSVARGTGPWTVERGARTAPGWRRGAHTRPGARQMRQEVDSHLRIPG